MHIAKDGKSAKVWLADLSISNNNGYTDQEMKRLMALVQENRDAWLGAWNGFFGI
ncbi:MAG: DUF4160 domain-containing protein [Pseudomonadota bacterium]